MLVIIGLPAVCARFVWDGGRCQSHNAAAVEVSRDDRTIAMLVQPQTEHRTIGTDKLR